jgi:N-acetylmuramoyl-L-alanine amidase/Mannosyl-glycoprotein endo-beta-N-acetylglucosaminidase
MPAYSDVLQKLVSLYKGTPIEFAELKGITVAQWLIESGRGFSGLATLHSNFAGIKWRPEMAPYAKRVLFDAPSETAYFSSFNSLQDFLRGYWAFLERPPYRGWRERAGDPHHFIEFIGPIWATDSNYADRVQDLLAEADALLESPTPGAVAALMDETSLAGVPRCSEMLDDQENVTATGKPPVEYIASPYQFSRNGARIEYIVLHYTTTRSLQSTINHFKSNSDQVACHYIISREGRIVQMVRDDRKCYHGNSKNAVSVGIEHSAAPGDQLTEQQEAASLSLIRWLKSEYDITTQNIIPHKCAPRATSCPGELFEAYGANGQSSCQEHHAAVQRWLADKL